MDRVYGVFRPKRGRSKNGWAVMGKRGCLIKCSKLEGIRANNENGSNNINLLPLSQLEVLGLYQINDLKSLPNKRLQNLISLRELYIKRFDGLGSLYWIGILTSPQSLNIWECPKLMSLHKGFAISHLYMN